MAEAWSKNPYVLVTEDDVCELIHDFDAENTKKQVEYAANLMKSFAWKHKQPIKRPEFNEVLYKINNECLWVQW